MHPNDKGPHPDASLTLREAFERHYDTSDLSPRSVESHESGIKKWEELTGNPPVGAITSETAAQFREACLAAGLTPATVNSKWRQVRAVLRRLAPPVYGNPRGLSIIETVPWMKPVKERHKQPRRIPLDDLARAYVACRHAQYPRKCGFPAQDWWRCLIVVCYTTGLRKGDLLAIRMEDVDLEGRTMYVDPEKTGKEDYFHLHAAAVEHIRRIWGPRDLLFAGVYKCGSRLYNIWHEILDKAGVARFGLHDLRRTAASEIDRVERGLGKVFLQHAPRSVTDRYYLNAAEELGEAIDKMRVPAGFRVGPGMAARTDEKQRDERLKIRATDYHVPTGPVREHWRFQTGAFWYRTRWFAMDGQRLKCLRALVEAEKPVTAEQLEFRIWGWRQPPRPNALPGRAAALVAGVRGRLRAALGLADNWDPVPCLTRGDGGCWTIQIPDDVVPPEPVSIPDNGRKRSADSMSPFELYAARVRAKLSQAQLAAMLGVSRTAVRTWERGTCHIPAEQAQKIRETIASAPNGDRTERRPTEDEEKRILATAGPALVAVYRLIRLANVSVSQAAALDVEDVDLVRGLMTVHHRQERIDIPLGGDLAGLVAAAMADRSEGPLFRTNSGRRWDAQQLCAEFRVARRVAGVPEGVTMLGRGRDGRPPSSTLYRQAADAVWRLADAGPVSSQDVAAALNVSRRTATNWLRLASQHRLIVGTGRGKRSGWLPGPRMEATE